MPTPRALSVAALGVAAVVFGVWGGVEEFLLVACTAAALVAVALAVVTFRARRGSGDVRVAVRMPASDVTVGASATAELTVVNVGRRPLLGLELEPADRRWALRRPGLGTRQAGFDAGRDGGLGARRADRMGWRRLVAWWGGRAPFPFTSSPQPIGVLPPGATFRTATAIPTGMRGLLSLAPVRVSCTDPFRLLSWRLAASSAAHVVVSPVPAPLDAPAEVPTGDAATTVDQAAVASRPVTAGDELSDLRQYRPGDRMARLHWPALARGELLVRDFVPSSAGQVTVLIDVRAAAHRWGSLERVVAAAAGIGGAALDRGFAVDVCTSSGERAHVAADRQGRRKLLHALALLDIDPSGPRGAPPAAIAAPRWAVPSGDGGLVLVTTGAGEASARPRSGRRPVHVVVSA